MFTLRKRLQRAQVSHPTDAIAPDAPADEVIEVEIGGDGMPVVSEGSLPTAAQGSGTTRDPAHGQVESLTVQSSLNVVFVLADENCDRSWPMSHLRSYHLAGNS